MSEVERSEAVTGPVGNLEDAVSQALVPQKTEDQSLAASGNGTEKGDAVTDVTEAEREQMSAMDTCGKYGGMHQETGEPCQSLCSFGVTGKRYGIDPGRCWRHIPETLEKQAQRKAAFLEAYMDQPKTLREATAEVGISISHPYLWKLTDIGFRKTFEALVVIVDAVRQHLAEDAMFERICNVEAGADTLRMFYHQNRSHGRWRDVRKDPAPAAPSNTIIQAGGDVTINQTKVWQVGDDFVSF